ncbi:fibulin-5 isoform X1 [Nerophis lumbriciformis]|uniref:fibulin-5 isoform X1 n=1 Tax=Nerophis lumbriciformis TaxID=546530 RepID=UPI002AE00AE0|nr:fibulin-5-like isoform X1 [Nerophis lumbriciformis]
MFCGKSSCKPSSSARMLAALLFILFHIQLAHGQQTCSEGFMFERRSRQCIDVDECRTMPDACRGDMRCVNQNGGYLCLPRGLYSRPFSPERPQVQQLPETAYGGTSEGQTNSFQPVPPERTAEPSYPQVSYPVPCILGYTLADDGTCTDVDECETNSHHCNPTQVCINTAGGYTCSCTEGFWLIGGQCQDIDECRYGYCEQLCANVPGSYSCSCSPGFTLNTDNRSCQDVNECEDSPCSHACYNNLGSFMCNCDPGFELARDGTSCNDVDECRFSDSLCQHQCVNAPGSFTCVCPPGYYVLDDDRSCEDINECDTGNNTCTTERVCFNFQGGYTCLAPLQCPPPYVEVGDNQCMCTNGNPACRDQPFTILYRHMDLLSGRSVPADIFQMQATTRYPGAFYIFQIKSGNEGQEFYMRQTSNMSATLVLSRPIKGPREVVLDLEMVTVNNVINFRGSSIIRLTVYVSEHPF